MEDVLGLGSKKVEHFFLTNEFNKSCAFYISIGMSYEQYWYGDPTMTRDYLEAYKMKEKREAEKTKWITWEQGLYVYEAMCNVAPILRAFSKSTKPLPYPERPHGVEEREVENEEIKKLKEQRDIFRTQIYFQNWARDMQKRFKDRKGEK